METFTTWLIKEEDPLYSLAIKLEQHRIQTIEQIFENVDFLLEFTDKILDWGRRVGSAGATLATNLATEPFKQAGKGMLGTWMAGNSNLFDEDPNITKQKLVDLLQQHKAPEEVIVHFNKRMDRAIESGKENPQDAFKREYQSALNSLEELGQLSSKEEEEALDKSKSVYRGAKSKQVTNRIYSLGKGILQNTAQMFSDLLTGAGTIAPRDIFHQMTDPEEAPLPGAKFAHKGAEYLGLNFPDKKDNEFRQEIGGQISRPGRAFGKMGGSTGFKGGFPIMLYGYWAIAGLVILSISAQWLAAGGSLLGLLGVMLAVYGGIKSVWSGLKGALSGVGTSFSKAWGEYKKDPSKLKYFRKSGEKPTLSEPQDIPITHATPKRQSQPSYASQSYTVNPYANL